MGRFAANVTTLRTVGQVVPAAPVAATCIGSPSFTARYGIVYSQMSAGPDRIIGFVRLNFARVATCPGNATAAYTATITRLPSAVAPANATAILATGFPAGVPPLLVSELVNKNLARTGVDYGALLAPVLAR
jgi:hypothetical protein